MSTTLSSLHAEDRALMARVRDGDTRAFEAIYDRYSAPVMRLALRVTASRRMAEEATQDAFLGLWRGARGYDLERGTVKTWLLAMVRNRSIDGLRREARHSGTVGIDAAPPRLLESPERTEDDVASRDEAGRTRQLILRLPAEQRRVIELTYFGGLTHTEVASRVGIPLGTVKGRQRLGLAKLRSALEGAAAPGLSAAAPV